MKKLILIMVATILIAGCEKDEIDHTPPVIDSGYASFPVQCSAVKRGTPFIFKARFTDDKELGSFGLDIHHNFDHHSHSTEEGACDFDPVKPAENPFLFLKNYTIPAGLESYEAHVSIDIPADIDTGNYHLMIKVTDKAGWQTLKGLSIRIIP